MFNKRVVTEKDYKAYKEDVANVLKSKGIEPKKKPDYNSYVQYSEHYLGRKRIWKEQVITEKSKCVTVKDIRAYETNVFLEVKFPLGYIGSTMGLPGVSEGHDKNEAYPIGITLLDEDNKEISDLVEIRITKDSPDDIIMLARPTYGKIKLRNDEPIYRFDCNVEYDANSYEKLRFNMVSDTTTPFNNIPKENIKLRMKVDLWA